MMSFPRDLFVQIHCPGTTPFGARINNAYATCGTKGTLETVRKLTGLPINYLITVNFRGFRQLVDAIGGIWMDVDRRYFNDRGGDFGYATINLFPGYQKLGGYQALDFVRYRHTDSDLYRVARQQLFVRAFKDQIKANTGAFDLPKVIKTITKNVEVGVGGNSELDGKTVLEYALFAYSLPPGHFFQSKIEGLEETSGFDILAPEANIQKAVQEFSHPDVESPQKATQVALNEKPKPSATKAPPPRETTITVLNGNGVTGSAGTASYLLSQRAYQMVYPPDGKNANAPNWEYFKTRIHYDKSQAGAVAAAKKVATLFGTDDVVALDAKVGALSNGAMLTVIVGQTFHGTLAEAPVDKTPQRQPANVAPGADASVAYLRERARKVPFKLMVPTVLERSSWIDRERPVRLYRIDPDGKHKTIRLTYKTGRERVLGRADDRLGGSAGALRAQLRPLDRRPHLRAPLHRPEAAHGGSAPGRCQLLGREHPARLALERDHARDRQGSQTALEHQVGRFSRVSRVAVFGAGYVGLVTGACFAELGHDVVVRDVVAERIERLRAGEVPIFEPGLDELLRRNAERLTYTLDVAEAVADADFLYVAVGTPPTYSGDADLSAVWTVVDELSGLEGRAVMVMKSTVPVGTGARVRHRLDERGLEHIGYASNPEFTAEGTAVRDFQQPGPDRGRLVRRRGR